MPEVLLTKRIIEVEALVSSESTEGAYFKVVCDRGVWRCSCPHFKYKKAGDEELDCKHIAAVKEAI
jgi:hypothetical protein